MAEPETRCQCSRLGPGFPCGARMTAEDLLCDACRDRVNGHAGTSLGGPHSVVRDRPGFPGKEEVTA